MDAIYSSSSAKCFIAWSLKNLIPSWHAHWLFLSTGLTSDEFCERLLYSKRVAVVPGGAFGASGEGFIRVSYSYSIRHITEALRRIEAFLEDLRA